jgi:hypothetical protein
MARYIKKFARVAQSLGPSEERGFALWVGYDIVGAEGELPGFVNVDGWTDEQLAERGVLTFTRVERDDDELRAKLGL